MYDKIHSYEYIHFIQIRIFLQLETLPAKHRNPIYCRHLVFGRTRTLIGRQFPESSGRISIGQVADVLITFNSADRHFQHFIVTSFFY